MLMLSRPDFVTKQILFIESDNSKKIKFKNSNLIVIDENDKVGLQHSCHKIFLVFILGDFSITSVMIKNAKKYGISIIFLNYNLKPYFSILSKTEGNFLLRKKQYLNKRELELAKWIIRNKILNQIYLIQSLRYKGKKENKALSFLNNSLNSVFTCFSSQDLLGIEGVASKIFFETYYKNFGFKNRKPRCKSDIFNLLLDIGYHYIFNFIDANLELYGFDTYCGFYHKFFFQRKSLVCDLVEPFRCIVDRRLRKSFNLKQINTEDFYVSNGQYFIKKEFNKKYSKIFLSEILKYKEEIFCFIQSYYRNFMKDTGIDKYNMFYLEREQK